MKFAGIALLTVGLSGQTPLDSNRLVQVPQKQVKAITASLLNPIGIAVDSTDNIFFTDRNQVVLRLDVKTGLLTLVAGTGAVGYTGDNQLAATASLATPAGLAVDTTGNVYVADAMNARVRKISEGVITTVAGNGTAGFAGDNGPGVEAKLDHPIAVTLDSESNLYIADSGNFRIRRLSRGVMTTVAGNGMHGDSGDGPADKALLLCPVGVALGTRGELYIAEGAVTGTTHRVRMVAGGVIATVAGTGTRGFSGDNGPAREAQLCADGIAVDAAGAIYIADTANNRIRKITNGIITTVAGAGKAGYAGDNGPATSALLNNPMGIAVDSKGDLYIADFANNRIRKVSNGVITTVAGNGKQGYSFSVKSR